MNERKRIFDQAWLYGEGREFSWEEEKEEIPWIDPV